MHQQLPKRLFTGSEPSRALRAAIEELLLRVGTVSREDILEATFTSMDEALRELQAEGSVLVEKRPDLENHLDMFTLISPR